MGDLSEMRNLSLKAILGQKLLYYTFASDFLVTGSYPQIPLIAINWKDYNVRMTEWTRLSIQTIPIIDRQLRALLGTFSRLRERIDGGEMEAVQQLADLRSRVRSRLAEIEQFCLRNEEVAPVAFLHPLRTRLQRIVDSVPPSSKINEDYNEVPWKARAREKEVARPSVRSSRSSVSPLKESKSTVMGSRKMKENVVPNADWRNSKSRRKESRLRSSTSTLKARQETEPQIDSLEESKAVDKPVKACDPPPNMDISFNNKEIFTSQKDAVFTFTLTKRQYEQVLRLKKKQAREK